MNTTAARERDGERESTTTMASASLLTIQLPNPTYPIRASTATTTTTQSPLPSVLDQKFGRKGIKFTESRGGALGVELTVRNGSSLRLSVPDGLVTSYKPKVYWRDDGFEEIVHTVGEGRNVKGGIGLVMNEVSEVIRTGGGSPWSASEWEVKDADSDSIDAVQVELSCTNGNGALEITYIISLYAVSMAMAVVVKNEGKKQVTLTSAMMSHLKFKSRYGSAIQGLKGCSYCSHPPISSKFGIVSPSEAMKPEDPGWSLFSFNNGKNEKQGEWYKEEDKFTILRNKLSRLYAVPPEDRLKRIYNTLPSNYKTIDQGNGLSFRVIRMGYDDIYIGSPGSSSQKYSNDHFICTGPASMLVPVVLNPGEEWRGAQVIEHDNL